MSELLQAIAVTAELTGTQLSEPAARVFLQDLSKYPLKQVLASLVRCRRELKGRLTLADVISRLEDGRPGPEEAWAAVSGVTEADTIVWTYEMQQAHGKVSGMIEDGETIPARMAFIERYKYLCQLARDEGLAVQWIVSLGQNAKGREGPVMEAVEQGKLTAERAITYLPYDVSGMVVNRLKQIAIDEFAKIIVTEVAALAPTRETR